jgi:parallel beta-helix repeat protein
MMKRIFVGIILVLLLTGMLTLAFNIQRVKSEPKAMDITVDDASIHVSVLIDYGNGSRSWYGRVLLPYGVTAFNATLAVATVNYSFYVDSGVLVEAINGVSRSHPCYWNWLYWNSTESVWIYGPVQCDKYLLTKGDIIAWLYENIEFPTGLTTLPPPRTIIVPDDYPKIQEAINAAIPGDTLLVYNGTYDENPIVNKTLLLIGESKSNTIIIGNVLVEASHVQFKGFSVEGDMPGSGVTLSYSDDSVISDNEVTSKRWAGIILGEYSNNNTVSNNIVVDNEYGINIGYFGGSVGCNNNVVGNNIVSNNTIGIEICTASTGNRIFGNIVENNSDGGILLLDAGTSDNKIYHNNMLHNGEAWHRNAEDLSSNIWDDSLPSGGNFWSDYTGSDADGDGIGDIPYVINTDSQDRYPLVHPWSSLPVHNMNTGLGYATIQEAINANETLNGHTIFVESATYYENVVVNKTVSLIGENSWTTIIDGNKTGSVISVTTNNVVIDGFTVSSSGSDDAFEHSCGVYVEEVLNVTIQNNKITDNKHGIGFWKSSNGVVSGNDVMSNNVDGIFLWYSSDNVISGNSITSYTLYDGIYLSESSSNLVSGNNIASNGYGIHLYESSNCTVSGNNIANNMYGIYLGWGSSNNVFSGNLVTNNGWGIDFYSSSNMVFHNNFINNVNQTGSPYLNVWDDGYPSGGNCWSDYNGTDLYSGSHQNETGSDGISDAPYTIDANNTDRYPLMGMFYDFNATSESCVQTICNSSISDFRSNGTSISFNVTGEDGTAGFCRICIPTALVNATYRVFVNGTEVPCNLLPCSNSTHSYLYFTYSHSSEQIVIVPEFPSFMILPLFMLFTMLAVVFMRRKIPRKHKNDR